MALALGSKGFAALEGVLGGLSSRAWQVAATRLREGHFCTGGSAAQCERVAAIVRAGCLPIAHWTTPPTWMGNLHTAVSQQPNAANEVIFDASLTAVGSVSCAGVPRGITLRFEQRGVSMRLTPAMGNVSNTSGLVERLDLDAFGRIHIAEGPLATGSLVPSPLRWWSSHEQLVVRTDLLQRIHSQGAVDICTRASTDNVTSNNDAVESAAQALADELLRLHGGGTLFTRRYLIDAAILQSCGGTGAQRRGQQTQPPQHLTTLNPRQQP